MEISRFEREQFNKEMDNNLARHAAALARVHDIPGSRKQEAIRKEILERVRVAQSQHKKGEHTESLTTLANLVNTIEKQTKENVNAV